MAENERPDSGQAVDPYFVVEMAKEGGVGVYTDDKHNRESMRTLFAVAELNDLDKSTLWRTLGPRGLIVQSLAVAFMHNPGLFEAIGAMMALLANDAERKQGGH